MGVVIENLYQPFEVTLRESDQCPVQMHQHTFFELIYILAGEGIHHISDNKFNYQAHNLFLITPKQNHHFEIQGRTTFLLIRFNNIYLQAQKSKDHHSNLGEWIHKLEYIFHNGYTHHGCIVRNLHDKPLVKAIIEGIILEQANHHTLQRELLQQLINTLITIVARNISYTTEKVSATNNLSMDIIHYIHLNIYDAEKLKAENIAPHFNISLNYISEYFKKHTSQNLQQYIINYKLSLAEVRLRHSDMRLNEIAYELGFTDESHLTKTFKKHKGLTPREYRKNAVPVPV